MPWFHGVVTEYPPGFAFRARKRVKCVVLVKGSNLVGAAFFFATNLFRVQPDPASEPAFVALTTSIALIDVASVL